MDTIEFQVLLGTLSIFRYITDAFASLSPSSISRILDVHDMVLTMVYVIENEPWKRRGPDGFYVFDSSNPSVWKKLSTDEMYRVHQYEAQAWLAMNNLLVDKETTRKYEYNEFRKDTVLKLSKKLNSMIVNQIPVLADTERYLSQLTIMTPPAQSISKMLYIEQVSSIREGLMKLDFEDVAKDALKNSFHAKSRQQQQDELAELADLFSQLADVAPQV
eukprot:CAMPEP_0117425420 /NCGR_PEP_ID=MMETSP0758-20121206/5677_1 /TAXON_ID=63605 /ORGANISM="Percolomonas cosmopolitus, Strain AE-1 (ATCC 50343)" /LENGTH=217 /DNA_ID=CAMNT_0005209857 /DNA_START=454 /DNA_END=1103 /DNA_ORIENTATION=-